MSVYLQSLPNPGRSRCEQGNGLMNDGKGITTPLIIGKQEEEGPPVSLLLPFLAKLIDSLLGAILHVQILCTCRYTHNFDAPLVAKTVQKFWQRARLIKVCTVLKHLCMRMTGKKICF